MGMFDLGVSRQVCVNEGDNVLGEILNSLLHISSASLTLVFAILGKSCIVFSNVLINVLLNVA